MFRARTKRRRPAISDLLHRLAESGFYSYRLSSQSASAMPSSPGYDDMLRAIKRSSTRIGSSPRAATSPRSDRKIPTQIAKSRCRA